MNVAFCSSVRVLLGIQLNHGWFGSRHRWISPMPVHDWTRVSDGTFHDFHYSWVLEIKRALKRGILPKGYYVMAEQFGGDLGAPDVLTLQARETQPEPEGPLSGTATLTETPPVVHARASIPRGSYARV